MSDTDYYQILGVPPDASEGEIKAAYRHLARFYHPDVNNAPEAVEHFIEVQKAYETLLDPIQRKEYDDKHRKEFKRRSQSTSTTGPVEHRPGQDSPQVSNPLDDSPYEEPHVPYFPGRSEMPSQPIQQRDSVRVTDLPATDPPSSPPREGIPGTWTHLLRDLAKTRVTNTFHNHYRWTKMSFSRQLNQLYRPLNQGQRAFLVQWIEKVNVKWVLTWFVLTLLAGLASFDMVVGLYYFFHLQPVVDFIRIILFILRHLIKVSG